MYFRLSKIPELAEFKLREKQLIMAMALAELSAPKKILLNICKLGILLPFFVPLAYLEGWWLLPPLLLAGLVYPLLTTPVEVMFSKKTLANAIDKFKQDSTQ